MASNTAAEPCPVCGGEMWDNRNNKKNPRQPDMRCKDRDNCEGAIWPERPKKGAPAAKAAPAKEAHSAGPHIPGLDGPAPAAPASAPAPAPTPAGTPADLANLLRVHREITSKVLGYATAPLEKAGGDSAGAAAAMVNSIFIEACRRRIVLPAPPATS